MWERAVLGKWECQHLRLEKQGTQYNASHLPYPPPLLPLSLAQADTNSTIVVTVDGQPSNAVPLAYDPPVLQVLDPALLDASLLPPASQRPRLTLNGTNFGVRYKDGLAPVHRVTVGNGTCGSVQWEGDGTVSCLVVGNLPVGQYNVTLFVAGRAASPLLLWMKCPAERYGAPGEMCKECPQGADCPGGDADPVSDVLVLCQPVNDRHMRRTCFDQRVHS